MTWVWFQVRVCGSCVGNSDNGVGSCPSTSVSLPNSHSINCCIFIDHPTNQHYTVSIPKPPLSNQLKQKSILVWCYCCNCLGERRWEGRQRSHFRKPIASVCHVTPCCENSLFLQECFINFVFRFVRDGWQNQAMCLYQVFREAW
jgi:hypothetical protein